MIDNEARRHNGKLQAHVLLKSRKAGVYSVIHYLLIFELTRIPLTPSRHRPPMRDSIIPHNGGP